MIIPFKGNTPRVHPGAFVADNATLVGSVTVGEESSVWFGAVIRGDGAPITIGRGSNVQDNATLHVEPDHPMVIGDNVTIGHNAVVHCASIGDNTLIGMGAVLLDGAQIGPRCIIAAGAVVKENAVVPEGTMLAGVPARQVKVLPPEYLEALEKPNLYVARAKEYLL